jgi:hypothetical protein
MSETRIRKGDVIHIVPDSGPERDMIVSHVEHHLITLIDLDPEERERVNKEIANLRQRSGFSVT